MLPEVQQTVNGLYERATDLARTLHAMDSNLDVQGLAQIEERIAALAKEPDDPERGRRLNLLERQRQTISDLQGRRSLDGDQAGGASVQGDLQAIGRLTRSYPASITRPPSKHDRNSAFAAASIPG